MDAEQSCGSLARHRTRNRRTPIAALRDVADALHQCRPRSGDAIRIPTGSGWPAGEAIARQGRDDDVESVLGAASVRGWIRKRIDDLELLDDGSRPAVRDDDRQRIRMTRTDVDEVNVHVIDRCYELRELIEFGLAL